MPAAQVRLPVIQPQLDRLGEIVDRFIELAQIGVGLAARVIDLGALQLEIDGQSEIVNRALRLVGVARKTVPRAR